MNDSRDLTESIKKVQNLLWQCQDEINKHYDYFKSKEESEEASLARIIGQKIYSLRVDMDTFSENNPFIPK